MQFLGAGSASIGAKAISAIRVLPVRDMQQSVSDLYHCVT